MKKGFYVVLAILVFCIMAVGSMKAYSGQYPSVNKTLCSKYLNMAQQALEDNNLALAKLFARKAIQADVFDMKAWKMYDSILVKMSGGTNTQTNMAPAVPSTPSTPAPSPQAPSGGGAFEGC